MPTKILLAEMNVYEQMTPLVSGYLQAYASKDPVIRASHEFHQHTAQIRMDPDAYLKDLMAADADVYAFSCYVWNMGIIKSVARTLAKEKPQATIIMGGHQAANHAERYLDPASENMYVCNGEGEISFYNFLKTRHDGTSDFSGVRGFSFYRDGQLITTEAQEKMSNVNDIPSPYLNGLFEKYKYSMAVFETNRGCPYKCSFCTWGGAGQSVRKFDLDRVLEEVEWLATSGVYFFFLGDANWGMLARDVDISRRIAECSKTQGTPKMVYYAAAKNKPKGSVACIEVFHDAGIVASQAIGVQSMDEDVLKNIGRSNIKNSKFKEMHDKLANQDISSYSELMWPLPGETVSSLKKGVSTLVDVGTGCIIIYPVLLINNAELTARRDEFGLVTLPSPDPADEAEIVTATNQVTFEDYQDGFWFFYALHALYNARGLFCLSRHLHKNDIRSYNELFDSFARFCRKHGGSAFYRFVDRTLENVEQGDLLSLGRCAHLILHEERDDFINLLREFVESQDWWSRPDARAVFEIDLINVPYVYSNTPVSVADYGWEFLEPEAHRSGRQAAVRVPDLQQELVRKLVPHVEVNGGGRSNAFDVTYQREQLPYMKTKSMQHNASYCHGMIQRANSILPVWTARSS